MGWADRLQFWKSGQSAQIIPADDSYASVSPLALNAWQSVMQDIATNGERPETMMVKAVLERTSAKSIGVPDVGFKGVRQQLFHRYNLIDLYSIAHNNSVLKTATGHLKQEVFRRGLRWDAAFDYRDIETGRDYTLDDLKRLKENDPVYYKHLSQNLKEPDIGQRVHFEQMMQESNVYHQSFMELLHMLEDDLNIADDAFLFLSHDYYVDWTGGMSVIRSNVRQMFRLDPVFVEYDTDRQNRPGFAHHVCLFHREELLDIPAGEAEAWQDEWGGYCPRDGLRTFPVMYRYSPYRGTFGLGAGSQGANRQSLYLVRGEVIHSSKFSPSELYGYSPVLSIYEKALSLIGMDRYLYDYFFERQTPQGVVTTITDNPDDLEARKEQMVSEVLNNPHYIPWLAVSSKTGQGRTEFVRFAYSLDELQFLPVQQHIERSISGLYGVPNLFMGDTDGIGGLNNESQQVVRLSRGAQLSQNVYNTNILPAVLRAFGITDWTLQLEVAEERSEQFELEMMQRRAQWAQSMVSMGFGVRYDQDADSYEVLGEVQSQAEQQEAQSQLWGG